MDEATDRIDIELLRQFIDINPLDGTMRWSFRDRKHFRSDESFKSWNTRYANAVTFKSTDGRGYLRASIKDKDYKAHLVAWALYYGKWPLCEVDHINGDKKDNSLNNLRSATSSQNKMNVHPRNGCSSQYKGVCWNVKRKKWESRIAFNGKTLHLGYFVDEIEAANRYTDASKLYHGEYARC